MQCARTAIRECVATIPCTLLLFAQILRASYRTQHRQWIALAASWDARHSAARFLSPAHCRGAAPRLLLYPWPLAHSGKPPPPSLVVCVCRMRICCFLRAGGIASVRTADPQHRRSMEGAWFCRARMHMSGAAICAFYTVRVFRTFATSPHFSGTWAASLYSSTQQIA